MILKLLSRGVQGDRQFNARPLSPVPEGAREITAKKTASHHHHHSDATEAPAIINTRQGIAVERDSTQRSLP